MKSDSDSDSDSNSLSDLPTIHDTGYICGAIQREGATVLQLMTQKGIEGTISLDNDFESDTNVRSFACGENT